MTTVPGDTNVPVAFREKFPLSPPQEKRYRLYSISVHPTQRTSWYIACALETRLDNIQSILSLLYEWWMQDNPTAVRERDPWWQKDVSTIPTVTLWVNISTWLADVFKDWKIDEEPLGNCILPYAAVYLKTEIAFPDTINGIEEIEKMPVPSTSGNGWSNEKAGYVQNLFQFLLLCKRSHWFTRQTIEMIKGLKLKSPIFTPKDSPLQKMRTFLIGICVNRSITLDWKQIATDKNLANLIYFADKDPNPTKKKINRIVKFDNYKFPSSDEPSLKRDLMSAILYNVIVSAFQTTDMVSLSGLPPVADQEVNPWEITLKSESEKSEILCLRSSNPLFMYFHNLLHLGDVQFTL